MATGAIPHSQWSICKKRWAKRRWKSTTPCNARFPSAKPDLVTVWLHVPSATTRWSCLNRKWSSTAPWRTVGLRHAASAGRRPTSPFAATKSKRKRRRTRVGWPSKRQSRGRKYASVPNAISNSSRATDATRSRARAARRFATCAVHRSTDMSIFAKNLIATTNLAENAGCTPTTPKTTNAPCGRRESRQQMNSRREMLKLTSTSCSELVGYMPRRFSPLDDVDQEAHLLLLRERKKFLSQYHLYAASHLLY
mmetsp:Transcript_16434/g.45846  ORF Transcript_16434/g.45846 Transcript_16434/m.45846 type:complete len:252 (-) Transcript_16434:3236-3991(-)